MKHNTITATLAAILLFIGFSTSFAADTLSEKFPRIVLVQLRSEHNRIRALTKDRMYQEVAEVEKDAQEVIKRIHLDFHENFDYCPVYYYLDTNADLVKERKFDGVLLNEFGEVMKNVVSDKDTDDYVIAYYGYALSQPKYKKVLKDTSKYGENPRKSFMYDEPGPWIKNASKYTYDSDPPRGRGLVILNSRFQQVTYFYKVGYDEIFLNLRKDSKKYMYQSKTFDIEYYPFAALFNKTRLDRYGHRRIE